MNRSLLVIGPFPGLPKGISLSNQVVFDGLKARGWKISRINTEHAETLDSQFGKFSFQKLSFLKSYLEVYKILGAEQIYITSGITFFGVLKYLPFVLPAKILGKELILHIHSDHLKTAYAQMTGWRKWMFKKIIGSFDKGIVLSESLRDNLTPFLPEQHIFHLYNFVQDALLEGALPEIAQKDFSEPRLFFLSNLIKDKGINHLLTALKRLQDQGIFVPLKIAGGKDPGNDVDALIDQLDQATYIGVVHGQAKKELLLWGNVFCLPTHYIMEGQPISILEAMTFDNLVLTTRHAGIPDICNADQVVFSQKDNAQDLYLKLQEILNNWTSMESKARAAGITARAKYTESSFLSNLETILGARDLAAK